MVKPCSRTVVSRGRTRLSLCQTWACPSTRSAGVWKADGLGTSWVNARDFILEMTRHVFVHAGCLQGGLSAQVHQGTCDGEAEAQTGTLGR